MTKPYIMTDEEVKEKLSQLSDEDLNRFSTFIFALAARDATTPIDIPPGIEPMTDEQLVNYLSTFSQDLLNLGCDIVDYVFRR